MRINIDEKIAVARSSEEKKAWETARYHLEQMEVSDGWYVEFFKQSCGHWKLFKNASYYRMKEIEQESKQKKCSRCMGK